MSIFVSKKSRAIVYEIFTILGLIFFDQIVKYIIIDHSHILYVCNDGIAFSIKLPSILFAFLWIIIIMALLYLRTQSKQVSLLEYYGFIMIFAGALSNCIDRFYYTCVIDYIPLFTLSFFNVADTYITCGAFLLLYVNYFARKNSD